MRVSAVMRYDNMLTVVGVLVPLQGDSLRIMASLPFRVATRCSVERGRRLVRRRCWSR